VRRILLMGGDLPGRAAHSHYTIGGALRGQGQMPRLSRERVQNKYAGRVIQ